MTESPASLLAKCAHTICLRGFSPAEQQSVSAILGSRGHRVVRSLGVAQFVVTGPDIEASLLSGIRSRGIQLASWEAVREELSLATESASTPDPAVPISRQPVLPMFGSEDGKQRFLDLWLPSCAQTTPEDLKLVPAASRFAGLCFDQPFVETLHAVITGTTHAMPVALEGETAASKTTAILYLAHRLGQAVVRLNLNGQTDAGELVGRYVPAEGGWAFHEGVLPVAMRRGHWLLLDEMNLAEPQVLERLNSALESPATLVLSEGPGTVFSRGGDVEPAADFRLLATLNPAEYSGRSLLSPAFRNRWLPSGTRLRSPAKPTRSPCCATFVLRHSTGRPLERPRLSGGSHRSTLPHARCGRGDRNPPAPHRAFSHHGWQGRRPPRQQPGTRPPPA
jgi:hypothetical protein